MNKVQRSLFLTGATGLLGSYLLKIYLEKNYKVFVFSRSLHNQTAKQRVVNSLMFWDKKCYQKNKENLIVIEGELSKHFLGINKNNLNILKNEVEEVFHCAASTQFNAPIEELRKINVDGTRNVLLMFDKFRSNGVLKKINYVSTAFVSGTFSGKFRELDLAVGQKFNNRYEQSKFEAEILVREFISKDLKIAIFRPSIVLGNYRYGKALDFKMFYEALHLLASGIYNEIPLNKRTVLNLIPVDMAAKAMFALSTNCCEGGIFHIVNPRHIPIVDIVILAKNFFKFKKPNYITLNEYNSLNYPPYGKQFLDTYASYFNFETEFDSKDTQANLEKINFSYPPIGKQFLIKVFKYCADVGFIKIKRRIY